jgi:hypothetical protein
MKKSQGKKSRCHVPLSRAMYLLCDFVLTPNMLYYLTYMYYCPVCFLKVHKNENFFGFNFEFCTISLLVMHK